MQTADVSVIIPAYNAASFVVDALNSIARQTLLPMEVIVINDGSTDQTSAIVREWIDTEQCTFPVYLHNQTNHGLPATRNQGIRRSVGKWIALLDADDIWEPAHLEELFCAVKLSPDAIAAYGAGRLLVGEVTDNRLYDDFWDNPSHKFGKPISDSTCLEVNLAILPRLIRGNFIKPSSLMFAKSIAGEINLFNESLRTAEDREFLVRLIHRGVFIYCPLPITRYRWHEDNISQAKNSRRNIENALRAVYAIMNNVQLRLSEDVLAVCRVEINGLVKGYLFSCSGLGWSMYINGFQFVAKLCGLPVAVMALKAKDAARALWVASAIGRNRV